MRITPRRILCLAAICLSAALCFILPGLSGTPGALPGTDEPERTLLRLWVIDAPGGAQSWLTKQLAVFEKQQPGVMTYLRSASAGELTSPDAVLPDMVLYMPGQISAPQQLFVPLAGSLPVREELLRCGRWKGEQYGLPLCWSAWVLAIDSALEPGTALTPSPTTLLGRPAATIQPEPAATPGYPYDAVHEAEAALQSPSGAALMNLSVLLSGEQPSCPEDFLQLTPAEVYSGFRARKYPTAMLTTGQITAFSALTSAGKGFPFRTMVPREIITDQVWLASLTPDAPPQAASLLAFLTGTDSQKALVDQGLHTVCDNLKLYAAGTGNEVERAAAVGLSVINAYLSLEDVRRAAWQLWQGTSSLSNALVPLL